MKNVTRKINKEIKIIKTKKVQVFRRNKPRAVYDKPLLGHT